jgi:hypothetical protein
MPVRPQLFEENLLRDLPRDGADGRDSGWQDTANLRFAEGVVVVEGVPRVALVFAARIASRLASLVITRNVHLCVITAARRSRA